MQSKYHDNTRDPVMCQRDRRDTGKRILVSVLVLVLESEPEESELEESEPEESEPEESEPEESEPEESEPEESEPEESEPEESESEPEHIPQTNPHTLPATRTDTAVNKQLPPTGYNSNPLEAHRHKEAYGPFPRIMSYSEFMRMSWPVKAQSSQQHRRCLAE